MSKTLTQAILRSARIAELRQMAQLVEQPVQVGLPRDRRRRLARLRALLMAERRRNAQLIETIRSS
jgi:hypothetical protein